MDSKFESLNLLGKCYVLRNMDLAYPIIHKQAYYTSIFSKEGIKGRHNFVEFFNTKVAKHAAFSIAQIEYHVYPISYCNKYLIGITSIGADKRNPLYIVVEFKNEQIMSICETYNILNLTPYSFLERVIKTTSVENISVFHPKKLERLQGKFIEERGKLMLLNISHIEEYTCITYVFQSPVTFSNGGWMRVPNMNRIRTSESEKFEVRCTAMVNYDGAEVYFNNCDECLVYEVYYFPISKYFTSIEIMEESGDKQPERFDFIYNDLL